jgi:mono/diheme cytochrome c family protein
MTCRSCWSIVCALTAGYLWSSPAWADDAPPVSPPSTSQEFRLFEAKVRPLLVARCIACHGATKQESGLRLDSRDALLKGGDSGPALVPGKPDESLLVEAIRYESYEMPPDEQLHDPEIAGVAEWIQSGAAWPPDLTLKMRRRPAQITDEDRAHWSFQPVADPPLPKVVHADWCRSGIDRFILHRLEQERLSPASDADPIALVRRVYFDLIGIPPTPEQVDAFLHDTSPDKYERLVDRLLGDPAYGEKWARHWLDVVRYAESDGWRQDAFRSQAYRYRDYVIRSFNEDKPYDHFVREQIAGDEIAPGDRDALTATAMLRHGIYEYNQRDVETQWDNMLNEITDVTGDAFLGLGMACARCHDHKFDPIPQTDYYQLRAFFEPLVWREDQPVAGVQERASYEQRLQEWKKATAEIRRELDEIERPILLYTAGGQGFDKFAPHLQAMMLCRPDQRSAREKQIASLSMRQLALDRGKLPEEIPTDQKARWETLHAELKKSETLKPEPLPTVSFTASDVGAEAPPTIIPGHAGSIPPGFLAVLGGEAANIETPPAALETTGRRTALARWLTDPDHPLTTRVIVNRIWQYHFGVGLAATPDDFGSLGEMPSHPQLLDWLTRRFVEDGWSIKQLHRRIMNSAVYRQTSLRSAPDIARQIDPGNRLLWRMNTRRLDAEQIRDAMLLVSGELDGKFGGPSVPASSPRRSVYVKAIRNTPNAILGSFDMADGFRSTAHRNVTTTPLQALLMVNGPFGLARANAMARRLQHSGSEDEVQQVRSAYRLAYGREPSADELRAAVAFLRHQASLVKPSPKPEAGAILVEAMPQTGTKAALLKPDSEQKLLAARFNPKLPDGDFTVEAIVLLESMYPDATVRTIVAQWDSNNGHPGWALGVTSAKSAYRPRNLILQMVGDTTEGKRQYEVIPSDIHLELNRPYYVAATVDIDDTSPEGARFYVDDLSVANEPPQVAKVAHKTVVNYRGPDDLTIGGRHRSSSHLWDGLIDEVRLSRGVLAEDQLLINSKQDLAGTIGHWRFENNPGMLADSSANGIDLATTQSQNAPPADPKTAALIDLCHVLLNSNEFLYVD